MSKTVSIPFRGLHPSGPVLGAGGMLDPTAFQSPFEDYILPDRNLAVGSSDWLFKFQSPFEDYILPDWQVFEILLHSDDKFQSPFEDYILPDEYVISSSQTRYALSFNPLSRITSFRT